MRPSLTVVTPAFEAGSVLGDCLGSVAAQTLPCEQVVVDGGSRDRTVEVARGFPHVGAVISEPDRGVYDAMNKGIRAATGEVVGILNADDLYAGPGVLERVAEVFGDGEVEACYGDLVYVDGVGDGSRVVRYWRSGTFRPERMRWGWMPPHPTFFVRRRVYEEHGLFDLGLGSAADYELMLRFLLRQRIEIAYLPEILVCMRVGGVSNASLRARLWANRMDRQAWRVNGLRPFPWTLALKPMRKIPQWWQRPSEGLPSLAS